MHLLAEGTFELSKLQKDAIVTDVNDTLGNTVAQKTMSLTFAFGTDGGVDLAVNMKKNKKCNKKASALACKKKKSLAKKCQAACYPYVPYGCGTWKNIKASWSAFSATV